MARSSSSLTSASIRFRPRRKNVKSATGFAIRNHCLTGRLHSALCRRGCRSARHGEVHDVRFRAGCGCAGGLALLSSARSVCFVSVIVVGAMMGMISSLLVFQYGQARIWYAMSRDGLLPKLISGGASAVSNALTGPRGLRVSPSEFRRESWISAMPPICQISVPVCFRAGFAWCDHAAAQASGPASWISRPVCAMVPADLLLVLCGGLDDGTDSNYMAPFFRVAGNWAVHLHAFIAGITASSRADLSDR